jgi:hypothetical protein
MGQPRHMKTERECFFHEGSGTTEPHFGGHGKDRGLSGRSRKASRSDVNVKQENADVSTLILDDETSTTMLVDELNDENGLDWSAPPPIVLPQTRPAPVEPVADPEAASRSRILTRLLGMADTYREAGSVRQAIEMYFELIREHAESPQALQAEDRLLDVAQHYEMGGELRQARGIYEQLL